MQQTGHRRQAEIRPFSLSTHRFHTSRRFSRFQLILPLATGPLAGQDGGAYNGSASLGVLAGMDFRRGLRADPWDPIRIIPARESEPRNPLSALPSAP